MILCHLAEGEKTVSELQSVLGLSQSALSQHLARESSRAVRETLLANLWRLEGAPWQASAASFAGDNDVYLRRAAAYSLSRSSDQVARAAQRRLVTDPEPVIRATALRGFERGTLTIDHPAHKLQP